MSPLTRLSILQEWTPWNICEAYAEKRGYRTDRRGRPDHQRAGSELVRDAVDGILPLFFLPPDYSGKDITPTSVATYCKLEEVSLEEDDRSAIAGGARLVEAEHEEEQSRAQHASGR